MEFHKTKAAISLKAVVINNKGEVLILKRSDNDYNRPNGLDLVGGGLDENEDPTEGLIREISEETGLKVEEIKPIDVISMKENDGCFVVMIAFQVKAIERLQKGFYGALP